MTEEQKRVIEEIIQNLKNIHSGICVDYGYESIYNDETYWSLTEDDLEELEKMVEDLEAILT